MLRVMRRKRIKDFLEVFGYYREYINKLGSYKLTENPTIQDIGISSGAVQQAYKEMREMKFQGTLVDYLCFLSAQLVWESISAKSCDFDSKDPKVQLSIAVFLSNEPLNAANFVRIVVRNPELILRRLEHHRSTREILVVFLSLSYGLILAGHDGDALTYFKKAERTKWLEKVVKFMFAESKDSCDARLKLKMLGLGEGS